MLTSSMFTFLVHLSTKENIMFSWDCFSIIYHHSLANVHKILTIHVQDHSTLVFGPSPEGPIKLTGWIHTHPLSAYWCVYVKSTIWRMIQLVWPTVNDPFQSGDHYHSIPLVDITKSGPHIILAFNHPIASQQWITWRSSNWHALHHAPCAGLDHMHPFYLILRSLLYLNYIHVTMSGNDYSLHYCLQFLVRMVWSTVGKSAVDPTHLHHPHGYHQTHVAYPLQPN